MKRSFEFKNQIKLNNRIKERRDALDDAAFPDNGDFGDDDNIEFINGTNNIIMLITLELAIIIVVVVIVTLSKLLVTLLLMVIPMRCWLPKEFLGDDRIDEISVK